MTESPRMILDKNVCSVFLLRRLANQPDRIRKWEDKVAKMFYNCGQNTTSCADATRILLSENCDYNSA